MSFRDSIVIRVWDEDTFSSDAVGFGCIKIAQLCFNGGQDHSYKIFWDGKKAGSVRLISTFVDSKRDEHAHQIEQVHQELMALRKHDEEARHGWECAQKAGPCDDNVPIRLIMTDKDNDDGIFLHCTAMSNGIAAAANESVMKAVDDTPNSKWCSFWPQDGSNLWIEFDFPRPVVISGYSFTSANDWESRDPGKWTFEA